MAWKRPATTIDVSFAKGTPPKIPYELGLLLVGVQTSIKEKIELGKLKDANVDATSTDSNNNNYTIAFTFNDAPEANEVALYDMSMEDLHKILNASYGYSKNIYLDIPTTKDTNGSDAVMGRKVYFPDGVALDSDTINFDSGPTKITFTGITQYTATSFDTNAKYGSFTINANATGNFVLVNGVIMPVLYADSTKIYVGYSGGDFPAADSNGGYKIYPISPVVNKVDSLTLAYDSQNDIYTVEAGLDIAENDLVVFNGSDGITYQLEVSSYDKNTGIIVFRYVPDPKQIPDATSGPNASVIKNFASEKLYEDAIYVDTSNQGEIIEVSSDNISTLGPDDPRNPLGFAARMALEGVLKVYAIAVTPDSDNNLDFVNGPQGLVHAHPEYSIISYHILHPDHDKDWKTFIEGLASKDKMRWAVLPVYNRIPDAEEKLYDGHATIASYQLTATTDTITPITDLQVGDYFEYNNTQVKITGIIDASQGQYLCDTEALSDTTGAYYRPYSNTERAQAAADQASGYASTWIWPFVNPVEYNFKGDTVYLDPAYLALMHFKTYTAYPIRRPWRGKTITKFEKALLSNNEFSLEEIELMQSGGNTVYENIGAGNIYTIDGLTSDMSADARLYQSSVMQTIYFLYLLKSYTQNITIKYGYLSTDRERVVKAVFSAALKDALNRSEPLVKFGTGIDSLELEGETGVSLKIIVETEKGFNYLDVLVTVE